MANVITALYAKFYSSIQSGETRKKKLVRPSQFFLQVLAMYDQCRWVSLATKQWPEEKQHRPAKSVVLVVF